MCMCVCWFYFSSTIPAITMRSRPTTPMRTPTIMGHILSESEPVAGTFLSIWESIEKWNTRSLACCGACSFSSFDAFCVVWCTGRRRWCIAVGISLVADNHRFASNSPRITRGCSCVLTSCWFSLYSPDTVLTFAHVVSLVHSE